MIQSNLFLKNYDTVVVCSALSSEICIGQPTHDIYQSTFEQTPIMPGRKKIPSQQLKYFSRKKNIGTNSWHAPKAKILILEVTSNLYTFHIFMWSS